ncbi:hypothetical protein BDV59DRAFT_182310 [Aspergillus ambiguus]|uniref:uncharacterized protein n=1 Tax=Aspergillus ambiguus TaxID=176160 RepID=UPI003CCCB92D
MSNRPSFIKKRHSDSARAKTQQRHRRKKGLFKKAAEFSLECEADVLLAVRIHRTGQIYILNSSSRKEMLDALSNLATCYPRPIEETLDDIIPQAKYCPSLDPSLDRD